MITLSWLLVIGLVGAILALIDGIIRVRGRGTAILAVIEIIVAALFILSFFVSVPFGGLILAIATLIVLILQLTRPVARRLLTKVVTMRLVAGYADVRRGLRNRGPVVRGEVLDDEYDAPARLEEMMAEQRATTTVRVRVPHQARWAADMYAERVEVIADDELDVTLDLALLPPVDHRLGLLLLAAGPDAAVLDPAALVAAGPRLAAELLAHHRSVGSDA